MSPIVAAYLVLGVVVGAVSGMVGLGGGVFIVPALVFLFGMSQHQAQGTTLALMVPPIGIMAALAYYRQGYVNIQAAAWICAGFVLGSWFGAHFAVGLPEAALRRVFGAALLVMGVKFLSGR